MRRPRLRIPKFRNRVKTSKKLVYDYYSDKNLLLCHYVNVEYNITNIIALPKKIIDIVYRKDKVIKDLGKPKDEMDYPDTSDFEAIKKTIESMRDSDILPALADAENNIADKRHWMEMLLPMLPILIIVVDLVS